MFWPVIIINAMFWSFICSLIAWNKSRRTIDTIMFTLLGAVLGPIALFATMGIRNELEGACPYCETGVKIPATLAGFDCPACVKRVIVRDSRFVQIPSQTAP